MFKISHFIGIDIGETNLMEVVVSKEGNIVEIIKIENEVEKGATYNLDKLINNKNEKVGG